MNNEKKLYKWTNLLNRNTVNMYVNKENALQALTKHTQ